MSPQDADLLEMECELRGMKPLELDPLFLLRLDRAMADSAPALRMLSPIAPEQEVNSISATNTSAAPWSLWKRRSAVAAAACAVGMPAGMWLNESRHEKATGHSAATITAVDATNMVPQGYFLQQIYLEPATPGASMPGNTQNATLRGGPSPTAVNQVQIYVNPTTGGTFQMKVPYGTVQTR